MKRIRKFSRPLKKKTRLFTTMTPQTFIIQCLADQTALTKSGKNSTTFSVLMLPPDPTVGQTSTMFEGKIDEFKDQLKKKTRNFEILPRKNAMNLSGHQFFQLRKGTNVFKRLMQVQYASFFYVDGFFFYNFQPYERLNGRAKLLDQKLEVLDSVIDEFLIF